METAQIVKLPIFTAIDPIEWIARVGKDLGARN